jgi:SAM-dependent methyltransferase
MNVILSRWLKGCAGKWLDIGGGRGPSYAAFLPSSCQRVATDLTAADDRVLVIDANTIFPMADGSYDGIFAVNMLYILRDPVATLRECRRVLRPEGGVVATFPFFFSEHPEPHDYWRWTREGVYRILDQAGFQQIEILPAGGMGTVWSMTMLPFGQIRLIRLLCVPIVWLWDRFGSKETTSFWVVRVRASV